MHSFIDSDPTRSHTNTEGEGETEGIHFSSKKKKNLGITKTL